MPRRRRLMSRYPDLEDGLLLSACLALCLAACRPSAPPAEPSPPPKAHAPDRSPLPADAVARAALPFHGIRTEDGARLGTRALLDEIAQADAVCVGEAHDNPHHHYAELVVLRHLARLAPFAGRDLGVGMEMFQHPYQAALDAYGRFESTEAQLLEDVEWSDRWGFDFALYRPILETARAAAATLLALNAPKELTRQVAAGGLASLEPAERARLPELDLSNAEHRQLFERAMREHPLKSGSLERYYEAQVLWDETMAERSAAWLTASASARQILILAGVGHCHEMAIPGRLERRAPIRATSVRPVLPDDGSEGDGDPFRDADFDYLLVFEPKRPPP